MSPSPGRWPMEPSLGGGPVHLFALVFWALRMGALSGCFVGVLCPGTLSNSFGRKKKTTCMRPKAMGGGPCTLMWEIEKLSRSESAEYALDPTRGFSRGVGGLLVEKTPQCKGGGLSRTVREPPR